MIHGPNSVFSGAFTMGKKYESAIYQPNYNPGPNHYSVKPVDHPIGFKFSKSNRKPLYDLSVAPNPGTYETKIQAVSSNVPSTVFPKAKDKEAKGLEIGPGSYNWNDSKKAPAFTFQSRFESIGSETLKNPGPGTYETKHYHTHQPNNKGLSTSKRTNILLSSNPGPGEYDVEIPRYQTNVKFPKSSRSIEQSQLGPGPGAFDLTLPKHPGITFGSRVNVQAEKSSVPGPGSYQLQSFAEYAERDVKLNKVRGVKIGTSQRNSSNLLRPGPSPLEYDVSKYKYPTRHASFGSAIRTSMISKEKTPGPGAYQVQQKLSKHGPIIPKASKEYSHLDNIPGPGKYNPNESAISNSAPSYHIAGKYDKPQDQSIVGPGRYNIQRDLSDGPKHKFPQMEKSVEHKSLDLNQYHNPQIRSHCYEIQQSVGFIPSYLLQN